MSDQKADSLPRMSAENADEAVMEAEDLTDFVQNLLQQMHTRFQGMTDSIISRLDDMGDKLNDLERSIGDITDECELDEQDANDAIQPREKGCDSFDKNDLKTKK